MEAKTSQSLSSLDWTLLLFHCSGYPEVSPSTERRNCFAALYFLTGMRRMVSSVFFGPFFSIRGGYSWKEKVCSTSHFHYTIRIGIFNARNAPYLNWITTHRIYSYLEGELDYLWSRSQLTYSAFHTPPPSGKLSTPGEWKTFYTSNSKWVFSLFFSICSKYSARTVPFT